MYRIAIKKQNGLQIGNHTYPTINEAQASKERLSDSLQKNCVIIPEYYISHENKFVQGAPVVFQGKTWIVCEVFKTTLALYGTGDNRLGLTPASMNETYIAGKVVYLYE